MRKLLETIYLAILVVGLSLITACAGTPPSDSVPIAPATPASVSATGAQQVTVVVANTGAMRFQPSSIVVRAGQPVELALRNEARIPHDFALTEGMARPEKIAAGGGQTATGTFTIEKPGTYTFICSVPGHESAGMKGTITAQ